MAKVEKTTAQAVEVEEVLHIERKMARFFLLGTSPLIIHRVGAKAQRELLMPKGKKTAADKASSLKHQPLEEYRECLYTTKPDGNPATRLIFPGGAFHQAIAAAALDMPGMKKAQIGRLCGVKQVDVNIFGVPEIYLTVVRNSDMNRTPDIRSRPILPQWAAIVDLWSAHPLIRQSDVIKLFSAAGIYIGIGDNRQQKGAGSFGLWTIVDENDKQFAAVVKSGGRDAQDRAIAKPAPYDTQTADLLSWFEQEFKRRGKDELVTPERGRGKNGGAGLHA